MEPRIIVINTKDLYYIHKSGVCWRHPKTKEVFRTCCNWGSKHIVDQLARVAYFTYCYNIIYCTDFYPTDYEWSFKFEGPRDNIYLGTLPIPF